MKKVKVNAIANHKEELSYFDHHKFSIKYDQIIETAYQETPEPAVETSLKKRDRKNAALALVDRLKALKGEICLFTKISLFPLTIIRRNAISA